MAFDSTIGGAESNSYATIAELDAIFELRINSGAWTALSESEKQAYAVTSTMMLEALVEWNFYKQSEDQALWWPVSIYPDEIPVAIVRAVAEQSLYMLTNGDASFAPKAIMKGVSEVKAEGLEVKFSKSFVAKKFADLVPGILGGLGVVAASAIGGGLSMHDVLKG